MWPHAAGCALQDQGRGGHILVVSAVVQVCCWLTLSVTPHNRPSTTIIKQRGHLWELCHEYQWHQWLGMPHQGRPQPQRIHQDCAIAPHVCHQGPGCGHEQLLRTIQGHQAIFAAQDTASVWGVAADERAVDHLCVYLRTHVSYTLCLSHTSHLLHTISTHTQ